LLSDCALLTIQDSNFASSNKLLGIDLIFAFDIHFKQPAGQKETEFATFCRIRKRQIHLLNDAEVAISYKESAHKIEGGEIDE